MVVILYQSPISPIITKVRQQYVKSVKKMRLIYQLISLELDVTQNHFFEAKFWELLARLRTFRGPGAPGPLFVI